MIYTLFRFKTIAVSASLIMRLFYAVCVRSLIVQYSIVVIYRIVAVSQDATKHATCHHIKIYYYTII